MGLHNIRLQLVDVLVENHMGSVRSPHEGNAKPVELRSGDCS